MDSVIKQLQTSCARRQLLIQKFYKSLNPLSLLKHNEEITSSYVSACHGAAAMLEGLQRHSKEEENQLLDWMSKSIKMFRFVPNSDAVCFLQAFRLRKNFTTEVAIFAPETIENGDIKNYAEAKSATSFQDCAQAMHTLSLLSSSGPRINSLSQERPKPLDRLDVQLENHFVSYKSDSPKNIHTNFCKQCRDELIFDKIKEIANICTSTLHSLSQNPLRSKGADISAEALMQFALSASLCKGIPASTLVLLFSAFSDRAQMLHGNEVITLGSIYWDSSFAPHVSHEFGKMWYCFMVESMFVAESNLLSLDEALMGLKITLYYRSTLIRKGGKSFFHMLIAQFYDSVMRYELNRCQVSLLLQNMIDNSADGPLLPHKKIAVILDRFTHSLDDSTVVPQEISLYIMKYLTSSRSSAFCQTDKLLLHCLQNMEYTSLKINDRLSVALILVLNLRHKTLWRYLLGYLCISEKDACISKRFAKGMIEDAAVVYALWKHHLPSHVQNAIEDFLSFAPRYA